MLAADRLNGLVDHFTQIHKGNQYNKTESEEKKVQTGTVPETHYTQGS